MSLFTEEEKNEVIAYFAERYHMCPFPWIQYWECKREASPCALIFTKRTWPHSCPCGQYSDKYVKDKFWKAMEDI